MAIMRRNFPPRAGGPSRRGPPRDQPREECPKPPREELVRHELGTYLDALGCLAAGYNVTSCITIKIIEISEQLQEKFNYTMFSKAVTLKLKEFQTNTSAIERYLKAIENELRAAFPLTLRITLKTETPLAVHLRNPYMPLEIGLAWHPLFNAPYIPATTLKGALRARARRGACGLSPDDLFGYVRQEGARYVGQEGALVITDALPTSSAVVEPDVITPHYREPDDIRETDARPTPIVFPVVKPGATFDFFVASRSLEAKCAEEVYGLIEEALAEGLGAKTRVGYGVVRLIRLK
jgi:CRISPR-associated protein Cmr6